MDWFHKSGEDLLECLLDVSGKAGKLRVNRNTLLPVGRKGKEYDYPVRTLYSLMRAYNIRPKVEDFPEGMNMFDDYLYCFVEEEFSKKRKKEIIRLLLKYCDRDYKYEIKETFEEILSSRHSRYVLFCYFFANAKQLRSVSLYDSRKFLDDEMYILEQFFEYSLFNFRRTINRILVLLMGDYADKQLDDFTE